MSIGAFGGLQGAAAGAPLSQTKGSEIEKNSQQASAAKRGADAGAKAEEAAGVGTTEEDQGASDRDADGRRMYEDTVEIESTEETEPEAITEAPKGNNTTAKSGNQLDLMG